MRKCSVVGLLCLTLFVQACVQQTEYSDQLVHLREKAEQGSLSIDEHSELLFLEFTEAEDYGSVVEHYEEYSRQLSDLLMPSLYYASALSNLAGEASAIPEQLMWVRRSIAEFDRILEKHPGEPRFYLWRSITYSHFPESLGMEEVVEQDIEILQEMLREGMELAPAEQEILSEVIDVSGN